MPVSERRCCCEVQHEPQSGSDHTSTSREIKQTYLNTLFICVYGGLPTRGKTRTYEDVEKESEACTFDLMSLVFRDKPKTEL